MKTWIIRIVSFLLVFVLGIIGGRVYQHLKTGYHYEILQTESFPFTEGTVTLNHTSESVGMPFLEPETSVLTLTAKYGLPITIYKAERMFQEAIPFVKSISIEANTCSWDDGIYVYKLTIEPAKQSQGESE